MPHHKLLKKAEQTIQRRKEKKGYGYACLKGIDYLTQNGKET